MTFGSMESWARRDYIKVVSRDDLLARKRTTWFKWLFWFCIFASLTYFIVPTVHAATEPVKNEMSDKEQERLYCHQALAGVYEVRGASTEQLKTHCKYYLNNKN